MWEDWWIYKFINTKQKQLKIKIFTFCHCYTYINITYLVNTKAVSSDEYKPKEGALYTHFDN